MGLKSPTNRGNGEEKMNIDGIIAQALEEQRNAEKEFLYIGWYPGINGEFVLKIGTTNDLKRRRYQHNTAYRKPSSKVQMPKDCNFEYLWTKELSKNNTHRYEDLNKAIWQGMGFGEYVENDRFVFDCKPESCIIKIKKVYHIAL